MKSVKCICKITFIFRGRSFQPGELLWIEGVTDEEYDFLTKNQYVTLCQESEREIEPETTALDSPPEKAVVRRGRKRKA